MTLAHLHSLSEPQIHEGKIVPTSLQDGETWKEIKERENTLYSAWHRISVIRAISMMKIFNIFLSSI